VNLIGLLSWWNEPLRNLEACITDSHAIGVTHLVALDGPYGLVGNRPSSPGQARHIRKVCDRLGIECHTDVLIGATEQEKRTELFTLGYQYVDSPADWFFVIDADTRITEQQDMRAWLTEQTTDAATCLVYEYDPRFTERNRRRFIRAFFRANPGLHVSPRNHYTYIDGQGRVVWGLNENVRATDAPVILHNHSNSRTATRNKVRDDYYQQRAQDRIEQHHPDTCDHCPEPWTLRASTNFHLSDLPDGTTEVISDQTAFVCPNHAELIFARNRRACYELSKGDPRAMDLLWQHVMLASMKTRERGVQHDVPPPTVVA
jgi:hypothetical protein